MRVHDLRVGDEDQSVWSGICGPVFPRRPCACVDVLFECVSLSFSYGVYPGEDEKGYGEKGKVTEKGRPSGQTAE